MIFHDPIYRDNFFVSTTNLIICILTWIWKVCPQTKIQAEISKRLSYKYQIYCAFFALKSLGNTHFYKYLLSLSNFHLILLVNGCKHILLINWTLMQKKNSLPYTFKNFLIKKWMITLCKVFKYKYFKLCSNIVNFIYLIRTSDQKLIIHVLEYEMNIIKCQLDSSANISTKPGILFYYLSN